MADRTDPWHVVHNVESTTGLNGYQINGPASFLIFGDDLNLLLHGVKVDDAIRQLSQADGSVGRPVQGTIPGTELTVGFPVTDEIIPPHTRYIEEPN